MSRIILTAHPDGEHHIAVGWDRPCGSFFWQEFNEEPKDPESGETNWELSPDWEEMSRFAGYMPHELPTMEVFLGSLPNDLRPLVTDDVQVYLMAHKCGGPNVSNTVVDMTDNPEVAARQEERLAKMVKDAE